jgi:hypothetical protein
MKKALALLLALTILSACGMAFVFLRVYAARDQVAFTPANVRGGAAADGLEVSVRTSYGGHLSWNTAFQTGSGAAQTEYRFFQTGYRPKPTRENSGVTISQDTDYAALEPEYEKLARQTPAGMTGKKTVRLRDYYEYYPLGVGFDMPGFSMTLGWGSVNDAGQTAALDAFERFFKIPVPPDETGEIGVTRDAAGNVFGRTSGFSGSLYSICALADDACYFTFDTHMEDGTQCDTSLIPGGYGVYCLPHRKNAASLADFSLDRLSMLYPLDPNAAIYHLHVEPDQKTLLLLTKEDGQCVLTAVDLPTGKLRQRLILGALSGDASVWTAEDGDGWTAIWTSENRLSVAERGADGNWRLALSDTLAEGDVFYPESTGGAAWNGEKLAVAGQPFGNNAREPTNFYLAVYDRTGLRYYGDYRSSLGAGNVNSGESWFSSEPRTVRWVQ